MPTPDKSMLPLITTLDIKPVPAQVLYINEPGTGDFCGMRLSDLDDAQWLSGFDDSSDNALWYAKPNHRTISASLFPLTW